MPEYDASTYGERIASIYDEWYREADPAMIDLLAGLADGGPTLELGIGSGRVAIPLVERGVPVEGVDASAAMVTRLHAKPIGASIRVTLGDFRDVPVSGRFRLVYVVFNTFFALLTQEDQVRCFERVAELLEPDGVFVLEVFVPDTGRFRNGGNSNTTRVSADTAMLDLSRHDPVTQRVDTQHVVFRHGGMELYPVQIRYAWPAELDLMARLAGLELKSRHAGWKQEPFSAASGIHVSVYGRSPGNAEPA